MEPIRRKLRRWILGEKNLPPDSILEQKQQFKKNMLNQAQMKKLTDVFVKLDVQLNFGFGFRFLKRIYKKVGVKMEEKEKFDFNRKTGYHRKMNQDSSGMTLFDFLEEISERIEKQKVENVEEFVDNLVSTALNSVQEV